MQRLDLPAAVKHAARVLGMMRLASAVGGGEQSYEHLVCDEFVFCSNFELLYEDRPSNSSAVAVNASQNSVNSNEERSKQLQQRASEPSQSKAKKDCQLM